MADTKLLEMKNQQGSLDQMSLDLEKMIDGATQPGMFISLYYKWYEKNIHDTMKYAEYKIPKMVKVLRETQDMMEFGMIIHFLSRFASMSEKSLPYVLNSMILEEEQEK